MKNQTEPIMEDSVTTAYVSVLETTRMDLLNSARKCHEGERAARKLGDTLKADKLKGDSLGLKVVANMIYEVLNRSVDDWGKVEEAYRTKGGTA